MSVTACVGHIVVPRGTTRPTHAASTTHHTHAPTVKKPRIEQQASHHIQPSNSNEDLHDVLTVPELSEESLGDALRRYALQWLEDDAAKTSDACATKLLDVVRTWLAVASTQWPVVRPPKDTVDVTAATGVGDAVLDIPVPRPSWVTWRFCFVPQVLDRHDSTSVDSQRSEACPPHQLDAATRSAFAAIPLPRRVWITSQATQDMTSGCVAAVLSKRIHLHDDSPHSTGHTPTVSTAGARSGFTTLPAALTSKPLLLVGAGGIGCEVLKVLVLRGFTHIHIIDLDTIDATNLNRQFLFQLPDVGHSKAKTACRVVRSWFDAARHSQRTTPPPQIVAYHDNIKAEQFDDAFYLQFAAVLNALDNVAARQHVNRVCMRNGIPLIESGTMGYNGQVQPIVKGRYECYDCRPKPPDTKTFAVCTIHARPTTMVHCVHYAKELYEVLFGSTAGEEDTITATTEAAEERLRSAIAMDDGEDEVHDIATNAGTKTARTGGELSYLRALVTDWRREQLPSPLSTAAMHGNNNAAAAATAIHSAVQFGARLLRHLFVEKVVELLSLKSSWPTEPPVPLDQAMIDRVVAQHAQTCADAAPCGVPPCWGPLSGDAVLPVADCVALFERAVADCLARPPGVPFKKDDDAAVRFVSATANLRAHVFHIAAQSVEEVRSIAGSIVPAIATTNATIAAAVVHELTALLSSAAAGPWVVYARKVPQLRRRRLPPLHDSPYHLSPSLYKVLTAPSLSCRGERPCSVMDAYILHSTCPNPPNALHCLVCQDTHPEVVVQLSLGVFTLGEFVHEVLEAALGFEGPSVSHGATVLYEDEDYEVLAHDTLLHLLIPPATMQGTTTTSTSKDTSTAESAVPSPLRPRRFVLTVDALNKEVVWSVVLVDGLPTPQQPATIAAHNASGETAALFAVSGLQQAQSAEQQALARLDEQRRLQAAEKEDAAATQHSHNGDEAEEQRSHRAPTAPLDGVEVIIADDDDGDDEVSSVVVEAEEGGVGVRAASPAHGTANSDDAVVILDE
jgi:ubiquitin-like 1-activating enzyme E1 B